MKLNQGNGGWYRVDGGLQLPGRVYFRIQEIDGSQRITELYLDGRGESIPAASVRKIPLQMLERWAGSMGDRMPRGGIGPDLSRLAAHFATNFNSKVRNWVADSMQAQLDGSTVKQAPLPRDTYDEGGGLPEVQVTVPDDGRISDDFLREVRDAFDLAIRRDEPPAITIAKAASVSQRTAQGWFLKARKRGIMPPPTSRGRIS